MSYIDDLYKVIGTLNYRGCLIERDGRRFKSLGKWHPSLKEAKEFIRAPIEWVEIEPNVFIKREYYNKTK